MKKQKIMTEHEMEDFIERIGRMELFDELEFIRKKEYFNPTNLIGRDSCYLKAIRVALVTLGYDETWVNTTFRDALEYKYFVKMYEPLTKEEQEKLLQEFADYGKQRLPDLNIEKNLTFKAKRIAQYTLDGKFITTFNSIKEANESLKKSPYATSIGDCCRGNKNSAYGYIWRYLDDIKR